MKSNIHSILVGKKLPKDLPDVSLSCLPPYFSSAGKDPISELLGKYSLL
jgi:hypothetical protein